MNFSNELYNKLTSDEWRLCSYYVEKAQAYYNDERWPEARESLRDAVAVCAAAGEDNAAGKIQYYLRFC